LVYDGDVGDVVSVEVCSASHNDDPYDEEDALAYSDASVEEVYDDGDDSNVAVGNISHCECADILFCLSHIHLMDTG
jgi:hypothetical protein